jgi:lauroyl/myristoyl acyltransferase
VTTAADLTDVIEPEMFAGPRRLRGLMRLLRRVPLPLAEGLLATAAVADGTIRRQRYRRGLAWAAAQGASGWPARRMAIALLANHGRFVAQEAMLGIRDPRDLAKHVEVRGADRLADVPHGAILLGFHVGPPHTGIVLRALGYPVRFTGRFEQASGDSRWTRAIETGAAVRVVSGAAPARLPGLLRLRNVLRGGGLVYLTADGLLGTEAFRVELKGRSVVLRTGWLALRRQTQAPVFPVLTHLEGRQRVIDVHPALPPADSDSAADEHRCREVLTHLLAAYVAAYPTQCRYYAFPPNLK